MDVWLWIYDDNFTFNLLCNYSIARPSIKKDSADNSFFFKAVFLLLFVLLQCKIKQLKNANLNHNLNIVV